MIGKRGRVYLPSEMMDALHFREGTIVEARAFHGAIVLIPMQLHSVCDPFAAYDEKLTDNLDRMTASELYSLVAKAIAKLQEKMDIESEK